MRSDDDDNDKDQGEKRAEGAIGGRKNQEGETNKKQDREEIKKQGEA